MIHNLIFFIEMGVPITVKWMDTKENRNKTSNGIVLLNIHWNWTLNEYVCTL